MLIFGIIVLLLVLFLLIRIRLFAQYDAEGFLWNVKILFFKLDFSKKGNEKRPKKPNKEKSEETSKKKSFGDLKALTDLIAPVFKTLGKLVRMLSVDKLIADVRIAGTDAFATAMAYGGACAGIGMIFPFLDNNINIKKKSISVSADFENTKSTVYMLANVSIRIWQIITLAIYLVFQYLKTKKGIEKNG